MSNQMSGEAWHSPYPPVSFSNEVASTFSKVLVIVRLGYQIPQNRQNRTVKFDMVSDWPVLTSFSIPYDFYSVLSGHSIFCPTIFFQWSTLHGSCVMTFHGTNAEPSLIEYARFHGLATDHLNQDPRRMLTSEVSFIEENAALADFKPLDPPDPPKETKFRLGREAAVLLASSIRPPPAPCLRYELSDHQLFKRLKVEPPALRTDHADDMRMLYRRWKPKRETLNLAPIPISEDMDEEFRLHEEVKKVASDWDERLAQEKLQMPGHVLKTMQNTLRPVYTAQMHQAILAENWAPKKTPQSFCARPSSLMTIQQLTSIPSSLHTMSSDSDPDLESCVPSSPVLNGPPHPSAPNADKEQLLKVNEDTPNQDSITELDNEFAGCVSLREDELFTRLDFKAVQTADKDSEARKLEPAEARVELPKIDEADSPQPSTSTTTTEASQRMVVNQLAKTEITSDDATDQISNTPPLSSAPIYPVMNKRMKTPPQPCERKSNSELAMKSQDIPWPSEVPKALGMGDESKTEPEVDLPLQEKSGQKHQRCLSRPPLSDLAGSFLKRDPRPLRALGNGMTTAGLGCLAGFMDTRKAYKRPRLDVGGRETYGSDLTKTNLTPDLCTESMNNAQAPKTAVEAPTVDISACSPPEAPTVSSSLTIFLNTRLLKSHHQLTQALARRPCPPLNVIYRDFHGAGDDPSTVPDMIISPTVVVVFSTLQATSQRSLPGQGGPSQSPIFRRIARLSQLFEKTFCLITLQSIDTSPHSSPSTNSQVSILTYFCSSCSLQGSGVVQLVVIPPSSSNTTPVVSQAADISTIISVHTVSQPDSPLYKWSYFLIAKHGLNPGNINCSSPFSPFSSSSNLPCPIVEERQNEKSQLTFLHEESVWEVFLRKAGLNPYAAQVALAVLKRPGAAANPAARQEEQQREQGENQERRSRPVSDDDGVPLRSLPAFVQMTAQERMMGFSSILGPGAIERVNKVLDARLGKEEEEEKEEMVRRLRKELR